MKIMEILAKDAVILNLGVQSKRDVLAEMAAALAKVEPQIAADQLLEVLLEREALQSTGIGEGVAIPIRVSLDTLAEERRPASEDPVFSELWREHGGEDEIIQRVVKRWRNQGR